MVSSIVVDEGSMKARGGGQAQAEMKA